MASYHYRYLCNFSHAIEQKGKDISAIVQSTNKSHCAICGQLMGQIQWLVNRLTPALISLCCTGSLKDVSDLLKSVDVLLQGGIIPNVDY